jgi:hypothetical protein
MKRSLRLAAAGLVTAGGLVVLAGPASAVIACNSDGVCSGDTSRQAGIATAQYRTSNSQLTSAAGTLSLHTVPPNPIRSGDPYYPGYGVVTAVPPNPI